jgi:aurora kinase, other
MNAEFTLPKFLSPEAKDFLTNIFVADPEERFGIEEIRNHPWYKLV